MLLKKQGKKQRGSMITEVLITTLLIVIAMLAVIPMLAIGVKSGAVSKGRSIEMHIAQERIEAFNSDNFSNVYAYLEANASDFDEVKQKEEPHEELETIYINPANGKKVRDEDTSNPADLLKNGYKKVTIRTTYNYLRGSFEAPHDKDPNPLDDSIQISVKVIPNGVAGAANKPVLMSAAINRDKF